MVWPLVLATGHQGRAIGVSGPPFVLAFTPDGHLLFAGDGDVITPIDVAAGTVRPRIQTGIVPGPGSPPLLVSRDGRTLYIAGESRIRRYNIATGRFGTDIRAVFPEAMLLSRDGQTLWYASYDDKVVAVDLATGVVKARIPVKSDPVALAMTPDGRTLYAAVPGSSHRSNPAEVIPIDIATGATGPGIPVRDPVAMAMAPDGRTLYVLATPQGTDGDGPTVGWVPHQPGHSLSQASDRRRIRPDVHCDHAKRQDLVHRQRRQRHNLRDSGPALGSCDGGIDIIAAIPADEPPPD